MGSPYNLCSAELRGPGAPPLPNGGEDYQDLRAWSPTRDRLALVRWRSEWGNTPVFSAVVVTVADAGVTESEAIPGCCQRIWWGAGGLRYQTADGRVGLAFRS